MSSMVLTCLMLAKFHSTVVQQPISEYAMATINHTHNGVNFEGTVIEGKMNSVSIEFPEHAVKTFSYAMRDHAQVSLSTMLDFKREHASLDCEINPQTQAPRI